MKRFILCLVVLFSIFGVASAQSETFNLMFKQMKMSEDGGKTWSDPLPVEGTIELTPTSSTLVVMGQKDTSKVKQVDKQKDGSFVYMAITSQNEEMRIIYSQKAKTVEISSPEAVVMLDLK